MKITGLSRFYRKALKKCLADRNISASAEINFTDKISLRRMDSLWYGGNMADLKYKGYTFHIEAIGDVYANLNSASGDKHICYVKDKNNNGNFGSEMLSYFRSDKLLHEALGENPRKYRLELNHNNWWECFVTDPHGRFHDLMWNLDEDNLFKAIADVLGGLDETIKNLEEDAA